MPVAIPRYNTTKASPGGRLRCCRTRSTIAGFEGIFCGLSAIYSAVGQIVNGEHGKTILPLG